MARITKASLEEFAKEIAALEAAEATILSTEEMDRYSGGRYGAYTSLGTSQSDHEAHALAGLEHDLLSTEVGMTKEERGGLYTLSSERQVHLRTLASVLVRTNHHLVILMSLASFIQPLTQAKILILQDSWMMIHSHPIPLEGTLATFPLTMTPLNATLIYTRIIIQ